MKIKDIALSAAYVGQMVVKAICVGAQEVWSAFKYIVFADPVVEQICATNWGDGTGLSEEDAAEVTDLGTVFKGNTEITSFDELAEFTGLTKLNSNDTEANAPFMGCTSLTSIKIPQSVTEIGERSFSGCTSLTEVGSLENVEKLGRWAFANTLIGGEVSMPNLVEIKVWAFQDTQIVKVSNLRKLTVLGGFSGCKQLIECASSDNITAIQMDAFRDCANLRNFVIPISVTSISTYTFYNCKKLDIILNVPNLVTIGGNAFHLSGIKAVKDLGKVKVLQLRTFQQCVSLETVILPSTLEKIEGYAVFYGCSSLKSVVIYATTPPQLEYSNSFSESGISKGIGYIYVPDESVQAYREASVWLNYADRIKPLSQYVES